jgi:hypothetical protein
MNAAELSFITLPRARYFDREMMRLLVREFARWAGPVDGGSLAVKLERQLCDGDGELDKETFVIFSKWNHTSGRYQSAEPIAQAISLIVYGHIIERHPSTLVVPSPRRSWRTLATASASEEPPGEEVQTVTSK